MKVIAESSSNRAEWVLCDGPKIVEHAFTTGLNPYFKSRRELSHTIRLELPEIFFKRRWDHVHFYGTGCALPERQKMVETSIISQFRTPCTVEDDILGAARSMLQHKPGLVCILGSGSNSGYYDGKNVVKNVRGLGYILGNEGSLSHIGKLFVSDVLKGLAPRELSDAFYQRFNLTENTLMDSVYESKIPSLLLAEYAEFLKEYIEDDYVHQLAYDSLMSFFKRNIQSYHYRENPVHFVGNVSVTLENILREVAADFGLAIGSVRQFCIDGLVQYHNMQTLNDFNI